MAGEPDADRGDRGPPPDGHDGATPSAERHHGDATIAHPSQSPVPSPQPSNIVDVHNLDWDAIRRAADPAAAHARMPEIVAALERLLERDGGPGLLFDADRADAGDRAIRVAELDPDAPLWFVGDLHGDLLALEAALALVRRVEEQESVAECVPELRVAPPGTSRIVFLGDLFDDGGFGLEVLLRVFALIADAPEAICVIAGNHDVALRYDGERFSTSVSPSDFSELLNTYLGHDGIVRAGRLAVRLFERAPRALFLPDGLLAAHGGFPLTDLHAELSETGDWNDPRCLDDFVWTRANPRARRKIPNRASRGSQFGREDFADFCALSAELGRPVERMVRGHDHVDERYAIYAAQTPHPLLTVVALSRRLPREPFGPYERVPAVARWVPGALPQVYRLHVPGDLIRELYPEEAESSAAPEAVE